MHKRGNETEKDHQAEHDDQINVVTIDFGASDLRWGMKNHR